MRTLEYAEGLHKVFLSLFSYSSIITKLKLLNRNNRNQTIC